MEISIRKLTIADVEQLGRISSITFYDTFTGTCTEEDMQAFLKQYYNAEQLGMELKDEENEFYFAEMNGYPVAYLNFKEDYHNFPKMKKWKSLELKRIYVLKEYHGVGVAQKLMDYFLNYAVVNAYEVVWLGVWEHNSRAHKFYKKYGFVDTGHTHDFPIGNTPQTDKWFWKFL